MLTCNECGIQQEEGKFCGKCGGKLVSEPNNVQADESSTGAEKQIQQAQVETASTTESTQNNTNEVVDKLVDASKNFGEYFVKYLKSPSRIFSRADKELTNGIISIVIASILIAFSIFRILKNLIGSVPIGGPTFFATVGNGFIFLLVAVAIVIALLFLISKLFGKDYSFQDMVSIFGAHMTPVIVVAGVTLLLVLLKSNTVGMFLIIASILLMITTFPLYLISSLLTKNPKKIDPLYGYITYIVAISITFSIFATILFDSAFGRLIDDLRYFY